VGSETISFSGRPGDFNSKDDFYVLSSGLKIVETSLLNYNKDNFRELNPRSVPCWLRATVASNLARDGQEWISYFSKYNSGTHSSQWVIVDRSQLKSNTNVVVFLEQAFALIKVHDMTERLNRNGFVASYNVAYDQEVYDKLDYQQCTPPPTQTLTISKTTPGPGFSGSSTRRWGLQRTSSTGCSSTRRKM
jgi:hypothetical protein